MSDTADQSLLLVLSDSWDRNNIIMLNPPRALPEGGLEARALEDSPEEEWMAERDRKRIAQMLDARRQRQGGAGRG